MVQREILKICCYIKQIYNNINSDLKTNIFASLTVLLQLPPLNHLHATKLIAILRIHFFKECEITWVNLKKNKRQQKKNNVYIYINLYKSFSKESKSISINDVIFSLIQDTTPTQYICNEC